MLRKCLKFLAIAIILNLISCGIPNYFYLGSSYITYNSTTSPSLNTETSFAVSFRVDDETQLNKCVGCPGIFLFYFLDNGDYYPSNYSTILSNFNTQYGAVSVKGALVDTNAENPSSLIETFVPSTNQDIKVGLYNFTFSDPTKNIERPAYFIPVQTDAQGKPSTNVIDFSLTYDSSDRTLILRYVDSSGTQQQFELARINNKSFDNLLQGIDSDFNTYRNENVDCQGMSSNLTVKLNIMAALCASNGSFDNIYWSQLKDVGTIDLN